MFYLLRLAHPLDEKHYKTAEHILFIHLTIQNMGCNVNCSYLSGGTHRERIYLFLALSLSLSLCIFPNIYTEGLLMVLIKSLDWCVALLTAAGEHLLCIIQY